MTDVLPPVETVALSIIDMNTTYQVRHKGGPLGLDMSHVDTLAERLEDPTKDLDELWLRRRTNPATGEIVVERLAGFHRFAAYDKMKRTTLPARIWDNISHAEAFELALESNVKDQLVWTRAERRLTVRQMFADPEMGLWSFARIAERVGIRESDVRSEWIALNPGQTEREVVGKDGKAYTFKIALPAPTQPPAPDLSFMTADEDDSEGMVGMVAPSGIPMASHTSISATLPTHNGNGNSYSAPRVGPPSGFTPTAMPAPNISSPNTVTLPKPRKPYPGQELQEMSLSWVLASGEEKQIASDGTTTGVALPAAVRLALINLLQGE